MNSSFFDLKCLEEAMASDKLGRVKEEAHRIAGYEIEKITSKKFFCSTSQLQTLQAVVALATGKITDSLVQEMIQSPDMRSMSWESIDADRTSPAKVTHA